MHFKAKQMNIEDIKAIAVCGAGTMGSGIAQAAAMAGFTVILFDVNEKVIDSSKQTIEQSLHRFVEKGKITGADKQSILDRICFTQQIQDCKAQVIIEAIIETREAKAALFKQLADINEDHNILATNTSSLSVTELQQDIDFPQRFAGMHFFNPAPLMQLVEIVKGEKSSAECISLLCALAKAMHKTPVVCHDAPGFIVNHVARPYYLTGLRLVEQGLATPETVDAALEAAGFRMGPFRLMDLIGIDINYKASCEVWQALGKPSRLKPSVLQEEKCKQGKLGKKTGEGFYQYQQK